MRIARAAGKLGITLRDHMVIGGNGHVSLRRQEMI